MNLYRQWRSQGEGTDDIVTTIFFKVFFALPYRRTVCNIQFEDNFTILLVFKAFGSPPWLCHCLSPSSANE